MTVDMHVAQPHSVWLCPENTAFDSFQHVVSDIARRQGGTSFAPHITLLGDIVATPAQTVALCKKAFAHQGSFEAKPVGLSVTPSFFMSLFIDLEVPVFLQDARQSLADALKMPPLAPFRPHLSFAYGLKPQAQSAERAVLKHTVQAHARFAIDHVVIAASSSQMPIEKWHALARVDLTPAAKTNTAIKS